MLYLLCIKFPVFSYLSSEHRLRYATSARNLCKNQKYGTIGWQKKNKIIKKKKTERRHNAKDHIVGKSLLSKFAYTLVPCASSTTPTMFISLLFPRSPSDILRDTAASIYQPKRHSNGNFTAEQNTRAMNDIEYGVLEVLYSNWAWRIVRHCTPSPPGQDT